MNYVNNKRVVDVMKRKALLKWNWAGHIVRMTDESWTKTIMDWRPPTKRLVGRPPMKLMKTYKKC